MHAAGWVVASGLRRLGLAGTMQGGCPRCVKGPVPLGPASPASGQIKSANVLLTRDCRAKIGDVGLSRIATSNYVTGVVGTLAW